MERRQKPAAQMDLFAPERPAPALAAAQRASLLPLIERMLTEAMATPAGTEGDDEQDHA